MTLNLVSSGFPEMFSEKIQKPKDRNNRQLETSKKNVTKSFYLGENSGNIPLFSCMDNPIS